MITSDNNNTDQMKMDYHETVSALRRSFETHRTRGYEHRLNQLKQLLRMYEEQEDVILGALKGDMNKSALEGYLYEVDLMKNECRNTIRNLKSWMSNENLPRNILTPADKAYYTKDPLGVVLIISPWNYPFQLTLVPLCGAIAAGNCVIIKPSELSENSAHTMAKLLPKYLDPECYRVVLGGPKETQLLLQEKFDHIFYTGSYGVGREIARTAAESLTPVTLELGGKSPCYIDDTVDYRMTAQRIVWGKCMNLGQTCVAPDYVLCTKPVESRLVQEMKRVMQEWYGTNWKEAKDLARIINRKHFDRLQRLIETSGGRVVMGGGNDVKQLWIEPTIVVDVKENSPIMLEETFGPVLPIYNIEDEDDAISFINTRPNKPLCLYVFSSQEHTLQRFQAETRSGTMAFNDTIIQFAIDELPFGGVGESGCGYYHGKFTFDTFTHYKSIVRRDFSLIGDQVGLFRYPPYTKTKINFLSFLLCHWKTFKFTYLDYMPHLLCFILGLVIAKFVLKL